MSGRVIVIMGSKSDLELANQVVEPLKAWAVPHALRVASAHKSVRHLLQIIEEARAGGPTVIIAIAGRSNALAGMIDANTTYPVITCPPISSAFAGADIYSSLRMPGGVAPLVVLDPGAAALAAAKILGLSDPALAERVARYQVEMTEGIIAADRSLNP